MTVPWALWVGSDQWAHALHERQRRTVLQAASGLVAAPGSTTGDHNEREERAERGMIPVWMSAVVSAWWDWQRGDPHFIFFPFFLFFFSCDESRVASPFSSRDISIPFVRVCAISRWCRASRWRPCRSCTTTRATCRTRNWAGAAALTITPIATSATRLPTTLARRPRCSRVSSSRRWTAPTRVSRPTITGFLLQKVRIVSLCYFLSVPILLAGCYPLVCYLFEFNFYFLELYFLWFHVKLASCKFLHLTSTHFLPTF